MSAPTLNISVQELYRVRKSFTGNGVRYGVGDIVDVTGWKNTYQMVESRYLMPVSAAGPSRPSPEPMPQRPISQEIAPTHRTGSADPEADAINALADGADQPPDPLMERKYGPRRGGHHGQ